MFNNYGPYMYHQPRLNFSNLLNGASKTLNVINQAIPIVKEVKPIISNARTILKIFNGLNNNTTENIKPINNKSNYNGPNFFI